MGADRPNVVLVMTDDQGVGDFGVGGNPVIRTPHIDGLAAQSVSFSQFYVSPVCSPTRACLMTGRYNYRTRVVDTYMGRSMMDPAEVTIAEMLADAGYATGIFGKWHLGDCYPMRPQDQGFSESLIHRGGGLAQPSDAIGNANRYTDPILVHNGQETATKGYCTDIYFREAERFIERAIARGESFFAYIATNAPHGPYHDVPEALRMGYGREADQLRELLRGDPEVGDDEVDKLTRIAAMITNIDDNVGRLLRILEEKGVDQNTLVIFLCDNGPTPRRFVGELRGMKTEVREGGIRSPLWLRWPARLAANQQRDEVAAHIDLTPTILEACGVAAPEGVELDGRSLLPLLLEEQSDWPEREIVIQAHRGDAPQRYHNFMIRSRRWKLVHASGFQSNHFEGEPRLELYDIATDPAESRDLASVNPAVVRRLLAAYNRWFDDVSNTRPDNFSPPRICVGASAEPQTVLSRNDWRGADWSDDRIGEWLVRFVSEGDYQAVVHLANHVSAGKVTLEIGGSSYVRSLAEGSVVTFDGMSLPLGDSSVRAWVDAAGRQGVHQVMLSRSNAPDAKAGPADDNNGKVESMESNVD